MANRIHSGTTTGGSVTQVVFATWYSGVEVVNRGTSDMWVRVDGTNPTIAGDECFYVAPRSYITVSNSKIPPNAQGGTSNTDVRMITAADCDYTVSAGV